MKPRIRPIRDLWFRFVHGTDLQMKLNAQQVADALLRAGIIELIPHQSIAAFQHYRDLDLESPPLEKEIVEILNEYLEARNGLT